MKIIYCDGSSLGNPGRGGFGIVAIDTSKKLFWEYGGSFNHVTNNQMELEALIFSLKLILKSFGKNHSDNKFEIRLDSKYVIQSVTEWLPTWVKNDWKNSEKKQVLNKDRFEVILHLLSEVKKNGIIITYTHVYGHTGEEWNERVDSIAKDFAMKKDRQLCKAEKF